MYKSINLGALHSQSDVSFQSKDRENKFILLFHEKVVAWSGF